MNRFRSFLGGRFAGLILAGTLLFPGCSDEPPPSSSGDDDVDIGGETSTPAATATPADTAPPGTATPTDSSPGDDDATSGDDDATSGDDDASSGDDDATSGDDDATSGDDDTSGGDDDATNGETPPEGTPPGDTTPGDTTPGEGTPTESPAPGEPRLTVSATALDFGGVDVGATADAVITLSNSGSGTLALQLSVGNLTGGDFLLDPNQPAPANLSAGASAEVTLLFTPSAEGPSTGAMTITSNDPDSPLTITLSGTGEAAAGDDFDHDGYGTSQGDCDDGDPSVYPGADEICDSKDNDCDGFTDEDGASSYYADNDGDQHGSPETATVTCDPPEGYVASSDDCDDTDPTVYTGAAEQCDGQDNDCDDQIDEGVQTTWYTDADGDGHGDGSSPVQSCTGGAGLSALGDDCDDSDASNYPGNTEACDGKDNDCDGSSDEGLPSSTWYADADYDSYGNPQSPVTACSQPAGTVASSTDCNDQNAAVHPGATEACDGLDNDCDSQVDEDGTSTYYTDQDGDGHGNPATGQTSCSPAADQVALGDDCDDTDAANYPGNTETCDGQDNDCDSQSDEGVTQTYYQDADSDGYGNSSVSAAACSAPEGYTATGGDCNDNRADVSPGAAEVCDNVDNDCDSQIDEGVTATFYRDADSDGYGTSSSTTQACTAPSGYVSAAGDCNDGDASVNPGASEVCDSKDNDCDGQVDDGAGDAGYWYRDNDSDGYGDSNIVQTSCTQPAGYVSNDQDCDDTDASIHPGADEIPGNAIDEDCDGRDAAWQDLNADGYPDLVVANYYDGSSYAIDSYIYWGSEDGISSSNRTGLPTVGAIDSCVADLDDDGYLDIVFANNYTGSTYSTNSYIYWGSESGYGTSSRTDLATIGARACEVADLDSDGDLDLVFADHQSDNSYSVDSYVYWNVAGAFSSANRTNLPTLGATEVTASDLDSDGYYELIFSNYRNGNTYTQNSYLYWGSASGYSGANRQDLPSIGALKQAGVTDLNGDGSPDIFMNNYYNGSSYNVDSYIYWGPSFGTDTRTSLPTNGNSGSAFDDFDQDGYLDIAIASYYDGDDSVNSYVYFGSSRGYSSSNRQSLPSNRARDLAVSDVDGDGFDDIVLAVYYDGSSYTTTSYVYYGSSSGFSSSSRLGLSTYGAWNAAVSDVDQDGYPDVLFSSYYDGDYKTNGSVYWNSSRGIAQSHRSTVPTQGAADVQTADLNDDGFPEVVVSDQYDGDSYELYSYVLWGNDPWAGATEQTALPTLGAVNSCIGDLNGDGYQDIVFANYRDDNTRNVNSYIYWGSSSGDFDASNRTELPTVGAWYCTVSDLEGDGDLDLVFADYYDGSTYKLDSYVYWNNNGVFSSANRLAVPTVGARGVVAADLDGNGYKDLVFSNYWDGSSYTVGIYVYYGDATGYSTQRRQTLGANGPIRPVLVEDIDGDDYLDILVPGYYDGDESVNTYVYWGSLSGYSDSDRTTLSGNRTYDARVADLNGDGYNDIVMATYYDGNDTTTSYVYWGTASGYSSSSRTSLDTYRSTWVEISDLDLNGYPDLVFATNYDGDYSTSSYIYYGSVSGFSSSARTSLTTYGALQVRAVDLDQDGLDELFFGNYREASDDYTTSSMVYWNSLRGISNSNRSLMPVNGNRSLTVVSPR